MALLRAGAETDKKDIDGHLALDLAPDSSVNPYSRYYFATFADKSCRSESSSSKVLSEKASS